ncbi:hypothetical protein OS493_012557 [Desmophyllum pertusum]|uniref:Uncharacterized protein n=1 Tax=Desmophyllum pertusum TaxID=174260 RepID=A0A9W9ZEH1_9CNID|nr:hypothetical protein OS493_012557 [Desmophyllum pertusum]
MDLEKNNHTCLICPNIFLLSKFVSLRNKCVLTCDEHKDGLGGIMAFESTSLLIDGTSKIDMSGKGYAGGDGGDNRGGGGYGGETGICPLNQSPLMGKGGRCNSALK